MFEGDPIRGRKNEQGSKGERDRRVDRGINRAAQQRVISRGEKLNGVVPSKGPYVEENGTMAVARPPEMESVKLTEGMERRVTAPGRGGGGNGRGKQGGEGTRGLYDRCPEIKGFRPPSEIKLTNRGNESPVRPLLASALPEQLCYTRRDDPMPDFFTLSPCFPRGGRRRADSNSEKERCREVRRALDPTAEGRGRIFVIMERR